MKNGRNRLTGGVSNTGPKGADAMNGTYSADKIMSASGLQSQKSLRTAGAGVGKSAPWSGDKLKIEGKPSGTAKSMSNQNGPDGGVSSHKGATAGKKGSAYISR